MEIKRSKGGDSFYVKVNSRTTIRLSNHKKNNRFYFKEERAKGNVTPMPAVSIEIDGDDEFYAIAEKLGNYCWEVKI